MIKLFLLRNNLNFRLKKMRFYPTVTEIKIVLCSMLDLYMARVKPKIIKLLKYLRKYLNRDSKKGIAEPFFQYSVLQYPFKRSFHKRSD